jgi:hypothetical protein
MGKKDKGNAAEKLARKIAKLEAFAADKSNPKPDRKAARREAEALQGAALEAVAPDEIVEGGAGIPDDASSDEKESARAAKLRAAAAMKATDAPEPEAEAPSDAALAARVHAKRTLRKAGLLVEGDAGEVIVDPDDVPRDRADLVDAYNVLIGSRGGHYLTSESERAEIDARLGGAAEPEAKPEAVTIADDPEPSAVGFVGEDEQAAATDDAAPVTIAEHVAVEVETEQGREFAVGAAVHPEPVTVADDFAQPSDAPAALETNGLGQYKIQRPSDGKLVGYTRVTTYIDNLEDKSALTSWKMRVLLEGLAVNETQVGTRAEGETLPPHLLAELRDSIHSRDVAIARAQKASRKGKLKPGELGGLVEEAWAGYKRVANRVAEAALDLGGVKDKAAKGTSLHALCELHDLEGIDAIAAKLEAGEISPADFDDVESYARALKRAGVKVIPELMEQVVVNDDLKVAGRLDRVVLYRFPGTQRAVRCVLDIKSGRLDFGAGKIAQQLELYATSSAYDLETHERTDLKLSRSKALVLHLPAGRAEAELYEVDLIAGRRGNRLSAEVRQWRNEGKRAIDLKAPLVPPAGADAEGGEQ